MLFNELVVSSLCWPQTLLHYFPNRLLAVLGHVSSISAGFQLPFSTPTRRAKPCLSFPFPLPCPDSWPDPGSSGSRQLPILLSVVDCLCAQAVISGHEWAFSSARSHFWPRRVISGRGRGGGSFWPQIYFLL
jgi:hypothetical protein